MADVRWTVSDRGFRCYAEAEGHQVHESSLATEACLWIDGEQVALAAASDTCEALPPGPWRDTLTVAIADHYQHRERAGEWKAGDRCSQCGSTDTTLENDIAACNGCGIREGDDVR